jgi:hypothetical protein
MPVFNIDMNSNYYDRWVCSVFQAKSMRAPCIRPRPLPFTFFPIHYTELWQLNPESGSFFG